MTTYYPISFAPTQYLTSSSVLASGYVLKAYSAGTSTPISMYTDYTGATPVSTITLNASGYPTVSGNIIIPHVAENYKLALYATQAAADANTGAIWNPDNIQVSQNANAARYVNHATDTGSANTYVIAPDPAISAYSTGMVLTLKPANANTAASTIAVSGLTAKSIKTISGQDPAANTLVTTGVYTLIYDGTNFLICSATNVYTGQYSTAATALTSTSNSIAVNLALNSNFTHTFTENTTIANPSNIVVGQTGAIRFTQHASSPKTLAYGSYYKFPGGSVPSVTATNSAIDTLYYAVRSATEIECNLVKGYA